MSLPRQCPWCETFTSRQGINTHIHHCKERIKMDGPKWAYIGPHFDYFGGQWQEDSWSEYSRKAKAWKKKREDQA